MADDIDRAQASDAYFRETAIQAHFNRGIRNTLAVAITECEDCGAGIPEARRVAVPSCTRCVDCQSLHENWRPL